MTSRVRAGVMLAIGLSSTSAAAAPVCAIHGNAVTLEDVRVAAAGVSLSVGVTDSPVTSFVGRDHARTVEVASALFFRGVAGDVPLALTRALDVHDGLVRLASDVKLLTARSGGDSVLIDVELERGVRLEHVPVACDDLTLGKPLTHAAPAKRDKEEDDGNLWIPRTSVLTFREQPGAGTAVRLLMEEPKYITVRVLRDDSKWQRPWVRARVEHGSSSIEGWVARSALVTTNTLWGHGMSGDGGTGGCGVSTGFIRHMYLGPAAIGIGAIVYAGEGKNAWALVQRSDGFIVSHADGSEWVTILSAIGVSESGRCGRLEHAHVKRADVTFPIGIAR